MADELTENGKALVRDMPQLVNMLAEKLIERFEESMLYGEKPHTNADRIRSMTDEELADWLGVYCNGQTAQEVGKPCVSDMGSCEECWLDWLKQEVDE